jgi:hypothetical protein
MKNKPIASSWDEVTVGLWQEIAEILKDQETDAVDKNVKLVGLLYDIPDEDAYDKPLDEFSDMLDAIAFLGKEPVVPNPAGGYIINGTKYIVCLNHQKITTAQYIDFKTFSRDIDQNMTQILSCLMVPEGHTYNDGGYEMEKVQADIRDHFRITHALSLTRFFFQQYVRLTVRSLQSLTRTLQKEMRKEKDQEKKKRIAEEIKKTRELEHMFGCLA